MKLEQQKSSELSWIKIRNCKPDEGASRPRRPRSTSSKAPLRHHRHRLEFFSLYRVRLLLTGERDLDRELYFLVFFIVVLPADDSAAHAKRPAIAETAWCMPAGLRGGGRSGGAGARAHWASEGGKRKWV